MRNLNDGTVGVLDVNRREPIPGGYSWERRAKHVAVGDTWEIVAEQLNIDSDAANRETRTEETTMETTTILTTVAVDQAVISAATGRVGYVTLVTETEIRVTFGAGDNAERCVFAPDNFRAWTLPILGQVVYNRNGSLLSKCGEWL